ncbi:MAG TPA: PRC-barrel domain-containing protein [Ktedonobacterales bacterium]|nr:PRC-barrel domain-containing protein [Ktedonobacterales bacterium]
MEATAQSRQKTAQRQKAASAATAPDNTLRATTVLGRRVIDSSNALILGFVDEIYFNFEARQVVALGVRAGWKTRFKAFFKGHKSRWVVPMHIVHRIGEYAVVIDREQAGIPINPLAPTEAEKKVRSPQKPPAGSAGMHAMIGRRVVNDDGELVGRLKNVLLLEEGPMLQGFEIAAGGLGRKAQRLSARARALGDVLLIPAHPQLTGPVPVPTIVAPVNVRPEAAPPAPAAPEPLDTAAPARPYRRRAELGQHPADPEAPDPAASDWLC